VFLLPLTGPAIGATTGLAAGSLTHIGLSDELLQRLRKRITPTPPPVSGARAFTGDLWESLAFLRNQRTFFP
jgi:Protein of unknown function (DUF1269)